MRTARAAIPAAPEKIMSPMPSRYPRSATARL